MTRSLPLVSPVARWLAPARAKAVSALPREAIGPFLLLLITLGSLALGMADTIRGVGLGLLWPIVLTGLPLGWALAASGLSGWLAAPVSLSAGLLLLLLHVGQLGNPLAVAIETTGRFMWQTAQRGTLPDSAPLRQVWLGLLGGATTLVRRLTTWLISVAQGQAYGPDAIPFDPVATAMLWGLALWLAVAWASWAVRRHARSILGVAPAVALLASPLSYVRGRALYLAPMFISGLVLKAVMSYRARRQRWQQIGADHAARIDQDVVWTASGLSLGLMILALLTPSISVYRIFDWARDALPGRTGGQQDIVRQVGLEPRRNPSDEALLAARASAVRRGDLPADHLIGSGPELSDQIVMVVTLESDHRDVPRSPASSVAPPTYWRGLTFDRYTGRGWSTTDIEMLAYEAGETAVPLPGASGRLVRQNVRLSEESDGLLYTAGFPIAVDRAYRIAWRTTPATGGSRDAFGATTDASAYRADSYVPARDEAGLRAAGQAYPDWVMKRYLDLPESVPDRVYALARDLTAIEPTPYDRALAIESHLRRMPYTLDLPTPPLDRDVADYFLFDLQRGYCDYYATAMAVLARAAGLPARLVTGYADGIYDADAQRVLITREHAHSWVEIYFPVELEGRPSGPRYTWITFEPTPSRPAIQRPADGVPVTSTKPQIPAEPITAERTRARWAARVRGGGVLLAVALAALLAWSAADWWSIRRMPPADALARLYRRLLRYGRWVGVHPRNGDTPHEFAAALGKRVADLAEAGTWGRLLLAVPAELDWMTDQFTTALYSLHQPEAADQAEAIRKSSWLRRRFWLARLLIWAPWPEHGGPHRRSRPVWHQS